MAVAVDIVFFIGYYIVSYHKKYIMGFSMSIFLEKIKRYAPALNALRVR